MPLSKYSASFERLYDQYNRREFVHPDPLEFLYAYDDPAEKEVVGLIASSLAYGRVAQILKSVQIVLDRLGPSPVKFLLDASPGKIRSRFTDFRHRFSGGSELAAMLLGVRKVIKQHGSLEACFASCQSSTGSFREAMAGFVSEIAGDNGCCGHLLARPER